MSETDAALPRETGQEKASATCPNCGAELGIVESPYGGLSAANCTKCYPEASPEQRQQASTFSTPRELGTPVGANPPTAPASAGADVTTPGDGA